MTEINVDITIEGGIEITAQLEKVTNSVPVPDDIVIAGADFDIPANMAALKGNADWGLILASLIASDIQALSSSQVNLMAQAQRDAMNRRIPLKTGQTVSYSAGDDGETEYGFGTDFFTLPSPNEFGNLNRFTNSLGGSVYDASDGSLGRYMIDHATGLGWRLIVRAAVTQALAIDAAIAATDLNYEDWRIPNKNEALTLCNDGDAAGAYNWVAWNTVFASGRFHTSNSRGTSTSLEILINVSTGYPFDGNKTTASNYIYVRNHYV